MTTISQDEDETPSHQSYSNVKIEHIKSIHGIEYPFLNARHINFDLILVASAGNFLDDFVKGSGLHIAIKCDGETILEFCSQGVKTSRCTELRWQQCLKLGLKNYLDRFLDIPDEYYNALFTSCATSISADESRWSKQSYEPNDNNCFDFAIAFVISLLRSLKPVEPRDELERFVNNISDKTKFCQLFILPKTRVAARYIALYRKANNR